MICPDASVAVKWILNEERSDRALALYRDSIDADQTIVAPPLLPLEVTNILRQRMRAAEVLPLTEAIGHLSDFLALPISIVNPAGLHHAALVLADTYGLPASYDAHYLALAEYLDCALWTDDLQLLRRVQHALPYVRAIGDYPLPTDG